MYSLFNPVVSNADGESLRHNSNLTSLFARNGLQLAYDVMKTLIPLGLGLFFWALKTLATPLDGYLQVL